MAFPGWKIGELRDELLSIGSEALQMILQDRCNLRERWEHQPARLFLPILNSAIEQWDSQRVLGHVINAVADTYPGNESLRELRQQYPHALELSQLLLRLPPNTSTCLTECFERARPTGYQRQFVHVGNDPEPFVWALFDAQEQSSRPGVVPIEAFVSDLIQRCVPKGSELAEALENWLRQIPPGSPISTRTDARTPVGQAQTVQGGRETVWLVAVVRPDLQVPRGYDLDGWIFSSRNQGGEVLRLPSQQDRSEGTLHAQFLRLHGAAIGYCRWFFPTCHVEMHIELFLPKDLRYRPVDQWDVPSDDEDAGPSRLGHVHSVVVRPFELLSFQATRWMPLRRRWQFLAAGQVPASHISDLPKADCVACVAPLQPSAEWYQQLQNTDTVVCVAIGCVVSDDPPIPTRQVVAKVLATGVPLVVWIRAEPSQSRNIPDVVREIVTTEDLNTLHLRVWQIRNGRTVLEQAGATPNSIGLLYDNPDRIPPTDDATNPLYPPLGRVQP